MGCRDVASKCKCLYCKQNKMSYEFVTLVLLRTKWINKRDMQLYIEKCI